MMAEQKLAIFPPSASTCSVLAASSVSSYKRTTSTTVSCFLLWMLTSSYKLEKKYSLELQFPWGGLVVSVLRRQPWTTTIRFTSCWVTLPWKASSSVASCFISIYSPKYFWHIYSLWIFLTGSTGTLWIPQTPNYPTRIWERYHQPHNHSVVAETVWTHI